MRNPLSKTITTIQPSGIRKFFDIVHEMKDAISLGVGEPDFDTPWHIRDEGIYSLEKGRTFYTSNAGLKELKIEIDKYLKRRFGVSYDYNNEIMVTVGGSEADVYKRQPYRNCIWFSGNKSDGDFDHDRLPDHCSCHYGYLYRISFRV